MPSETPEKTPGPAIAIAGASGFVGTRLRAAFMETHPLIALTRSPNTGRREAADGTDWRTCDLFSLPQVEEALGGAHTGVYLVHSMLPSSRLLQGDFRDLDLLLADNFARGAKAAGLRHLIYLGGLIPDQREGLSPHLASRLEVERVLRASGLPVTVLRAGLILGPGGSSTRMLLNLVRRLPVMILPRWTRSETRSIDVRDVVRAFREVLADPTLHGGTFDLAGHPPMTYRDMIMQTGEALGSRPVYVHFPLDLIKLSRLWVTTVSGVSPQLVNPLLESLTHTLRVRPNPLQERTATESIPFRQSVLDALDGQKQPVRNPRAEVIKADRRAIRSAKRVRSVQRLPLPPGWDAERVADEYGRWLTRSFRGLLHVDRDPEKRIFFKLRFPSSTLLALTPTPYSRTGSRRRAFYITGGALAHVVDPPGRLEFRVFDDLGSIIAAIHGYAPRLPWWIYAASQAHIHLWVMRAFGRHLARLEPPE